MIKKPIILNLTETDKKITICNNIYKKNILEKDINVVVVDDSVIFKIEKNEEIKYDTSLLQLLNPFSWISNLHTIYLDSTEFDNLTYLVIASMVTHGYKIKKNSKIEISLCVSKSNAYTIPPERNISKSNKKIIHMCIYLENTANDGNISLFDYENNHITLNAYSAIIFEYHMISGFMGIFGGTRVSFHFMVEKED